MVSFSTNINHGQVIEPSLVTPLVFHSKFTLVILYRGRWCQQCQEYMTQFNSLVSPISDMGGQIIAVCSQAKSKVKQTIEEWDLRFPVVSDELNTIAGRYDMNITLRNSDAFREMVSLVQDNTSAVNELQDARAYRHGICQPGVLILTRDGTLFYKWKGAVQKSNRFGCHHRVEPSHLLEICRFNFDCSLYYRTAFGMFGGFTLREELKSEVFDFVMNNEIPKDIFYKHLIEEGTSDWLQFLDSLHYTKCWTVGEDMRTVPPYLISIHNDYTSTGSSQEIGLSSTVKEDLMYMFTNAQPIDLSVFDAAEAEAREFLLSEAFARFQVSPKITEVMRMLPSRFKRETSAIKYI